MIKFYWSILSQTYLLKNSIFIYYNIQYDPLEYYISVKKSDLTFD